MSLLAVLFSLMSVMQPLAIAALVLLALAVIGHVAGNALGTRLRQNGSRPVDEAGLDLPTVKRWPRALSPDEFAPATQLSRRSSLGRPIFVATVLGTIAGGIGGGLWPAFAARNGPELASIVIGVVAFAVLGGIGTFGMFSFAQVLLGALRQANAEANAICVQDNAESGLAHQIPKTP